VALIAVSAVLHHQPDLLPPGGMRDLLQRWRRFFEGGVVVIGRPETFLPPADSAVAFIRVALARIVYFFWFQADAFSPRHQLVNLIGHVPLYGLALVGLWAAVLGRALDSLPRLAALVAAAWIAATCLFHAATILDFDWRYRAPVYPALIFLAALGITILERALRSRPAATPTAPTAPPVAPTHRSRG
jgi:hypothetical protein